MIKMGDRFGYLEVIGKEKLKGKYHYQVRCNCGTIKLVQPASLLWAARPTRSCGCMRKQWLSEKKMIHGHWMQRDTPEYRTFRAWHSMMSRCNKPANKDYARYGGRGIKVCKEWSEFQQFRKDMGVRPDGLSLGRIDNEAGYSAANCRWETPLQQGRNTCKNRLLTFGGFTHTVSEWAERTGINQATIRHRIDDSHWSIDKALTEPVLGTLRVAYG